ncbi:MAG: cell division protein FtsH [Planctomycetota bacterium]
MNDDDETVTAYHEAGHAVIAWALGAKITALGLSQASEFDDDEQGLPRSFGQCHISWGCVSSESPDQKMRELMTSLAGPVAEQIYTGDKLDLAACAMDFATAGNRLQGLPQDRVTRVRNAALTQLRRALNQETYWAAVSALADEILVGDELESEHVESIIAFWLDR